MRYHIVDPVEVSPEPGRPCEKRSISDVAGLTELGCHLYIAVGTPAVDDPSAHEP